MPSQIINPKLVWERYIVPQRMKPGCTEEEKAWPDYITYDPEGMPETHENMFTLSRTSSHDGNIANTYDLIYSLMEPLIFMRVVSNNFKGRKDYNAIKYVIGDINMEVSFDTSIAMGNKKERGNVEVATLKVISYPHTVH
jgi:hypothetical protein